MSPVINNLLGNFLKKKNKLVKQLCSESFFECNLSLHSNLSIIVKHGHTLDELITKVVYLSSYTSTTNDILSEKRSNKG